MVAAREDPNVEQSRFNNKEALEREGGPWLTLIKQSTRRRGALQAEPAIMMAPHYPL